MLCSILGTHGYDKSGKNGKNKPLGQLEATPSGDAAALQTSAATSKRPTLDPSGATVRLMIANSVRPEPSNSRSSEAFQRG